MNKQPEPDDVEVFVGDVKPDESASIETARFIEEYKKRPEYFLEAAEARKILDAQGIGERGNGMPNARLLLAHWHRCVADLIEADLGETNGRKVEQENLGVVSDAPRDVQN